MYMKQRIVFGILAVIALGLLLYIFQTPPTKGDWQPQLSALAHAEFSGDKVTIRNVRNFRYYPTENDTHPNWYDRTYDLSQLKKVWYITEPFKGNEFAAHTFLSFEFENGDFLAISIEARKTKAQEYSVWKGALHAYPLMYIPADERDVLLVRTVLRDDKVYIYPVKTTPQNARALLTSMLERMNDLAVHPKWYNTIYSNCTSNIARHVNEISPGRLPFYSWRLTASGYADEMALSAGLLDTDLDITDARKKYFVTDKAKKIGDVPEFSARIRKLD
jgi:hypothetical protein